MSYIDIVWKSNNNKLAFINTLNTNVLDVMTSKCNVTISGVKQITEKYKVNHEFDWILIEDFAKKYEHKYQFKNYFKDQFLSKKKFFGDVDLVIRKKYNICQDIYNMEKAKSVFQKPSPACMEIILNKLMQTLAPRKSPVFFGTIQNVISQAFMDYIQKQKQRRSIEAVVFSQQGNLES